MPERRPLPTIQGGYDEPSASTESVTIRRARIRRMLRHLGSEDNGDMSTSEAPLSEGVPRAGARSSLRRRRSVSPLDAELETNIPGARRRNKRRRLDHSPPAHPARQPIKYGHYGQVEAGRLKMELVSCDGGEHRDPRSPDDLGPQNILRHDKSVYCSERSSVNIVLRHADDTAFCLEKLHIVAPENGFTSPVREGIVYVAMTMSELQGHIRAPTASPPRINVSPPEDSAETPRPRIAPNRSIRSSPERLTLADALRDPEIDAALTEITQPRNTDNLRDEFAQQEAEQLYVADFGHSADQACLEPPHPHSPSLDPGATFSQSDNESRSRSRSRLSRPFALLSDEEPGPEDSSPPGWAEYRLQRLRNMRRRYEIEHWNRDDRWAGLNRLPPEPAPPEMMAGDARERAMWNLSRLDALMARSRVRDDEDDVVTPRSPSPPAAVPPSRLRRYATSIPDSKHAPEAVSGERPPSDSSHVTRAHFHIKKSKHKVAIKFSPPVSGRFVLLKLWSGQGQGKGNVDLQTVILKGFGGGRFFPAVEMR